MIIVLTGAGISAESGLKTFRDAGGLWEGHRVDEVATPEAFERNPSLVHRFYNARRKQLEEVRPNEAHFALAQLEKRKKDFLLITQNVDDLHQRAGNQKLIAMHGELRKVRCLDTDEVFSWTSDLEESTPHPKYPERKARLRPHICWFGEMPFHMEEIQLALQKAQIFISIGTSGQVYPAANFVNMVPKSCRTVLLNKEDIGGSTFFQEVVLGAATKVVPKFLETL